MERPAIPRFWRGALIAIGILPLASLLPYLWQGSASFIVTYVLWALGSFGVGIALAGSMIRRGGREIVAAFGGIVIAVAYTIVGQSPFHLLAGFGLGVALGLVMARPDPIPSALAALGFVANIFAHRALMSYRGPFETIPRWPETLLVIGTLTSAAGFVAYALRARVGASRPAGAGLRIATLAGGLVVLGLSWLVGGSIMLIPLWPIAFALLLLPALLRWRAWPAGALVVGMLGLAGAAPAGTCMADPWSDAVDPSRAADADARPMLVHLYQVGGNGPLWNEGEGFSGTVVRCPSSVVAFGALWALALVVTSGVVAVGRRRPPVLEPTVDTIT